MQSQFHMVVFQLICPIEAQEGPGIGMNTIVTIAIEAVVEAEAEIVMDVIGIVSRIDTQAEGGGGAAAGASAEALPGAVVQLDIVTGATVAAPPEVVALCEVAEMLRTVRSANPMVERILHMAREKVAHLGNGACLMAVVHLQPKPAAVPHHLEKLGEVCPLMVV